MKIYFSKIISLICAATAALAFSACSTPTTAAPDTPVEFICVMDYTGSVYSPMRSTDRFPYEIKDINGKFIAYLDTSRIVAQRVDTLMGKCVVVRGYLVKMDGDNVMRADSIKLKR